MHPWIAQPASFAGEASFVLPCSQVRYGNAHEITARLRPGCLFWLPADAAQDASHGSDLAAVSRRWHSLSIGACVFSKVAKDSAAITGSDRLASEATAAGPCCLIAI